MSIVLNINDLNDEQRKKIHDELKIEVENSKYNIFAPKREVYPYLIEGDNIYLPFGYAVSELSLIRPSRTSFPSMNVLFEGKLREAQEIVKKESIKTLYKTGTIIISLSTGLGKTILSINLATEIKLKTLVIVNKIVLINQWEKSIKDFCPKANITKIIPKVKMNSCSDMDSDFYIINAMNVAKKPKGFFDNIGLVILDEIHQLMAESLSKCLFHLSPRYLIGLSATPYRYDCFDALIEFYFGKNKIIRGLNREHTVYKVNTGFTPKVEITESGKMNWGALINSQSMNEERNEYIIRIIKKFSNRNIIVMSKRIEQSQYIYRRLVEEGESVTDLIGNKQEFDKDARILVAITNKVGTGFDHPKMDCLILASDVESFFIQILGRVLRRPDIVPIIFDLVDNNGILEKHFKTRKEVYKEVGGKIVDFKKVFPSV